MMRSHRTSAILIPSIIVLLSANPKAYADPVVYVYQGDAFTSSVNVENSLPDGLTRLTGSFTVAEPMAPSSANGVTADNVLSFSFTDGVTTVTHERPGISFAGTFNTDADSAIVDDLFGWIFEMQQQPIVDTGWIGFRTIAPQTFSSGHAIAFYDSDLSTLQSDFARVHTPGTWTGPFESVNRPECSRDRFSQDIAVLDVTFTAFPAAPPIARNPLIRYDFFPVALIENLSPEMADQILATFDLRGTHISRRVSLRMLDSNTPTWVTPELGPFGNSTMRNISPGNYVLLVTVMNNLGFSCDPNESNNYFEIPVFLP